MLEFLVIFVILTLIVNIKNMAVLDDINTAIQDIKDSTGNIAADLDRIADQVAGGIGKTDAAKVATELRSAADALRAVADRTPEDTEPPVEPA